MNRAAPDHQQQTTPKHLQQARGLFQAVSSTFRQHKIRLERTSERWKAPRSAGSGLQQAARCRFNRCPVLFQHNAEKSLKLPGATPWLATG
eukprot:5925019-Alexandrium_andersonii.AAC.1